MAERIYTFMDSDYEDGPGSGWGRGYAGKTWVAQGAPAQPQLPAARHNFGVNVGFADGHVAYVKYNDAIDVYPQWIGRAPWGIPR